MRRSAARRTSPFRGRGVSIGVCQVGTAVQLVGPAPPRHGALGGRQVWVHASLPCVKVDQVETTRTLARDGHSMAHVRRVVSVAGVTTPEVVELVDPVAYPGFFGCPETPPPSPHGPDLFKVTVVTPLLAPTFNSQLNLRLLETPLRPSLDTPLRRTRASRLP